MGKEGEGGGGGGAAGGSEILGLARSKGGCHGKSLAPRSSGRRAFGVVGWWCKNGLSKGIELLSHSRSWRGILGFFFSPGGGGGGGQANAFAF